MKMSNAAATTAGRNKAHDVRIHGNGTTKK